MELGRRGGLKPRVDMKGIGKGVEFEETRKLIMRVDPVTFGVLSAVMSGGVLTRERLFRHGRIPGQGSKCILPGCDGDWPETREHRYWHCMHNESMRPEEFKRLRARIQDLDQCTIQCGIATKGFHERFGVDISVVQQTMVDIEIATRAKLDEMSHGAPVDASEEQKLEMYKKCTGGTGKKREFEKSKTKKGAWQAPQVSHPSDRLAYADNDSRVSCKRCGKTAQRKYTNAWRDFWNAECEELQEGEFFRAQQRSKAYWKANGQKRKDNLFKEF